MMKKVLLLACIICCNLFAQAQLVNLKYEGAKDIRAICGNYFIYITLADIKDAYLELPQAEQQKYAELMDLPNGIKATINIIQGSKAPASIMEPVVQRHVGGHLLKQGLAYIQTKDGKKITTRLEWKEGEVTKDEAGFDVRPITFYDADTKKMVFIGTINNVFK